VRVCNHGRSGTDACEADAASVRPAPKAMVWSNDSRPPAHDHRRFFLLHFIQTQTFDCSWSDGFAVDSAVAGALSADQVKRSGLHPLRAFSVVSMSVRPRTDIL
jgi:hypothetical protein